MSFVIAIDTARWRAHQDGVRDAITAAGATLVPVAKGNGYGVGNVRLAAETRAAGAGLVAVGTAHEAAAVLGARARHRRPGPRALHPARRGGRERLARAGRATRQPIG